MTRPIDAVVTGFTKNGELCRRAFEPLQALRQQGIIRNIHYVTWDSAEIDAFVAPAEALEGIELTRVTQPDASGNPNQRGIVYQTRNLEAALARIAEPDTLVVKLRPDFVFRADFLKSKLQSFETKCTAPAKATFAGIKLPRYPFARKIWIPWADANQPFFYEDAAYIGLNRDLAQLITPDIRNCTRLLSDMNCGSLVHVLRYAGAFLPRFPIFKRYVENYGAFANDISYRNKLVGMLLADGFFWHLLIAHAWVMHTSFHIDSGEPGDLKFFPNTVNAEWNDFEKLKLATPYDQIRYWREGTKAGHETLPALSRCYGRLVDDAWPRALFTQKITDMPDGMLGRLAHGLSRYSAGHLSGIEDAFYEKLRAFHEQHWVRKQAA